MSCTISETAILKITVWRMPRRKTAMSHRRWKRLWSTCRRKRVSGPVAQFFFSQNKYKCVQFPTDQFKHKADFLLQKGRCLNVAPDYSAEAEKCLSRAVKLEPGLVEGWNTLGEQYWKKEDLTGAKNCFTGALQQVWTKKFATYLGRYCTQNTLLLHCPV